MPLEGENGVSECGALVGNLKVLREGVVAFASEISAEALGLWSAPRRTTRGGQRRYSDMAIELCLTLGLVFKQPLRQAQGLMRSMAELLGVEIAVPDLLDQIDGSVDLFLADSAYDGSSTRGLLAERFGLMIDVKIPLPKNAAFSSNAAQHPMVRDHHIVQIQTHGRMA